MAKKPIRHVKQHAKQHHEAHETLKSLLGKDIYREKVLGLFVGTFLIVVVSVFIFFNWGRITKWVQNWNQVDPEQVAIETTLSRAHGYQSGILTSLQINGQKNSEQAKRIQNLPTQGYLLGTISTRLIGRAEPIKEMNAYKALSSSIVVTNELLRGEHLSSGQNKVSQTLQKSLLTTVYLGQNTVTVDSTLKKDAQLLSKIYNTLQVDLFAYLNQSNSRATSLENYLKLLERLQSEAITRSADLESQINFLTTNFEAQELAISSSEEQFFQNLDLFNAENADQELAEFINLSQMQTEVRAKIGAYQGLKDYYDYFLPRLDTHIRTIQANRDALIAGVRVVEIENMTLDLIIEE